MAESTIEYSVGGYGTVGQDGFASVEAARAWARDTLAHFCGRVPGLCIYRWIAGGEPDEVEVVRA